MHHLHQRINEKLDEIIAIRQTLHQTPELKFEEWNTAQLICHTLKAYGILDIKPMAKTGVVAMIDSGQPGNTIALRADMDALPIQEATNLAYQSTQPNKMHACGHDGHTAVLLLTAYVLQQLKTEWTGKIKLIFQPAEEGGKGSSALIEEGVLQHPTVDAIFGWHIWPGLQLGTIATKTGTLFAGNGRFEIIIKGRVAHMAMPHDAINPVTIGAELITRIAQLQKNDRDRFATLNIIRFECGEIKGGMCDEAKITGVYFVDDEAVLTAIKKELQTMIEQTMKATHAHVSVNYFPFHRPTINTQYETEFVLQTAQHLFPDNSPINLTHTLTASEDFSEYLFHVPGCFYLIGAGIDHPPVHTNQFDFPDQIITHAASILSKIAMTFEMKTT